MAGVGGIYDFSIDTPMGQQSGTFTVVPSDDGATFTGSLAGGMGSMDVEQGQIDGNRLTWVMQMTSPMPMKLDGEAEVNGDAVSGSIKAGFMGSMAFTATRQA